MATLAEVIREQEHTLREKGELPLTLNKFLAANPPEPDSPHIDLQIQEAVEELRRLKAEHIELQTKELFMKVILTAKSLDDLPTSQETGRAEVSLQEAKRDLRKVKADREKAEAQQTTAVAHLGNTVHEFSAVRHEGKLRLRQARSTSMCDIAWDTVRSRDISRIESLVKDIDELDASSCRDVKNVLREERRLVERQANQQTSAVENLRREVEELETEVRDLNSESRRLKQVIDAEDKRSPGVARLRHGFMLQKEVERVLAALTGVRVSDIAEHRVSFDVNTTLWLPFTPEPDRAKHTHTVDIEFSDEYGDQSYVSHVSVRPPDVNVADVAICNDSSTSLCLVMQTVCKRLATFMSQRELQ